MSSSEILCEFKKNLITFIDELIGQFPSEIDFIFIRIYLKDQIPIEKIMDIFLTTILKDDQKIKKMARERNEAFFLDNVFDSFGKDKVDNFKKLWRSGRLDKADKKIVWSWFDTFIYLADKYNKLK